MSRRALHTLVATSAITVAALLGLAVWIFVNRPRTVTPHVQASFVRHVHRAEPERQPPPARVDLRSAVPEPIAARRSSQARVRRSDYSPLISAAARRHNLSPLLVAAIARVESGYDPATVSHKGARGIMQVIPETGLRFGVQPHELFDPERNLSAGTAYMAWLLRRYDGDLDLALAGYNAGEGAVDKYGGIPPYRETQEYVRKVRRELARLTSL